jgi:hypothetical protein
MAKLPAPTTVPIDAALTAAPIVLILVQQASEKADG